MNSAEKVIVEGEFFPEEEIFENEINVKYVYDESINNDNDLWERAKKGSIADRNHIVVNNLLLVRKISNFYLNRGVSEDDLFQSGCIGLVEAVKRYERECGNFSYYASVWIRKMMILEIYCHSRTIRIREDLYGVWKKIVKFISEFEQAHYPNPTMEDIAQGLNKSIKDVEDVWKYFAPNVSINDPVGNFHEAGDENKQTWEEILGQEHESSIIENLFLSQVREVIFKELKQVFGNRSIFIVFLRHGIGTQNKGEYTLTEIGRKIGISHERTGQLERKYKAFLRNNEVLQLMHEQI